MAKVFLGYPTQSVKEFIINQFKLKNILCFTAQEANSTVGLQAVDSAPAVNLQTSTDGNTWIPYSVGTTLTLANVEDKVMFKAVGQNRRMATNNYTAYNKFVMTGKIAASGNVNSLLEEDVGTAKTMSLEGRNCCYAQLFRGCTSLTTAPELPAQTLANDCYYNMFFHCINLTGSITIPASSAAIGSYLTNTRNMIYDTGITDLYLPNVSESEFRSKNGYGFAMNETKTVHCSTATFEYTFPYISCFKKGTLITMVDGSKKKVEELTLDDVLKVWDFDEGRESSAKICWNTRPNLWNDHYYKVEFSDGTVLNTTGQNSNHKLYNVKERFFKGVDKTEVGDQIWSENGIVTVTAKTYVEEPVEFFNLMTQHKINCYAESILTADRYGNLYPIGSDMKYIKDGRTIRPFEDFKEFGITQQEYEDLRLGEVDDTVQNIVSYIEKCRSQS